MILHSTSSRNTHFVSPPCTSSSSSYSGSLSQPAHDAVVLVGGTGRADALEVFGGNLGMWHMIAASRENSSINRMAELGGPCGDLSLANEQTGNATGMHSAATRT
jgi:hypothetical protein